jgi:hypothetical protein
VTNSTPPCAARTRGIPHYDGLYDQSIYFDQTMSAYFLQKGWMISQFSILRPLSEMLIETILARRYPELLPRQMSCHAASKKEDRVLPCGRCEKCRRIVGMFTAIGVDPRICGYNTEQIRACLDRIVRRGVHQEGPAAAHLLFLLERGGHVPPRPEGNARPHSEVMHLRIDPRCSPLSAIPLDLREPLLAIFGAYSEGALERRVENGFLAILWTIPTSGCPSSMKWNQLPLTSRPLMTNRAGKANISGGR